jgi:hypothetical protein
VAPGQVDAVNGRPIAARPWRTLARDLLALNVACGAVLLLGVLVLPDLSQPYLAEVANHAQTPSDLALYLALVTCLAVGREVIGRSVVQRFATRRFGIAGGLVLGTLAVSVVHARYGLLAAGYGALTALVGSVFYARTRRLTSLLVWHVQWDVAAVVATCLLAMAMPNSARTEMLYAYKAQQVAEGSLVFDPDHGWVDTRHADPSTLRRVSAELREGAREVQISTRFSTAWGGARTVRRAYRVGELPDEDVEAVACALFLDHAVAVEQSQERLPFWLGTRVSAFQPDDLTGNALACAGWAGGLADRERWRREGRSVVAQQVREVPLPPSARARLKGVRRLWQPLKTATVKPWGVRAVGAASR